MYVIRDMFSRSIFMLVYLLLRFIELEEPSSSILVYLHSVLPQIFASVWRLRWYVDFLAKFDYFLSLRLDLLIDSNDLLDSESLLLDKMYLFFLMPFLLDVLIGTSDSESLSTKEESSPSRNSVLVLSNDSFESNSLNDE